MAFQNIKQRASRYVMAGVIAGSLALATMPGMAFAAANTVAGETVNTGTDTTKVYLEADDGTLSVSAPTEIHVMVKADGSFITPSAASTQIKNASIFGVHVDKITAAAENGFALVTDAATTSSNDAVQYSVQPNSGTAVQIADYVGGNEVAGSDWDMTKAGTEGDHLDLTTAGAINNVTKDLNADQQFATLTWTFQAGANA